ncbi:glycosyltransferase family 2 protein [Devosia sp. XGJD_8]|uniref:glycosyltransferase family 2 protein n=1 Tax=Devosia sp. XGJD_8 TaxID=3391187 RepID=UPI003985227E
MIEDLVSIVTPAYKAEGYVAETIRSVQAQSYRNWEMLIVEDGSPDKTAEVVASYAETDLRIRLIRQVNSGPAMARQKALDHAQGRYIAFLDSDDLWLPEKLATQLAFMTAQDAVLSFTGFRRINADGTETGRLISAPATLNYHSLLGNTAIATSTVIIDRQKSGPFNMTKTYYDDFVLWLGILKRGHLARGLDADLMRYRVLGLSVSRNKWRSMRMVWKTYRDIERLSLVRSAFAFARYAWNAWWKYRQF